MRFGDSDAPGGLGATLLAALAEQEEAPGILVPCRDCGTAVELSRAAYDFAKVTVTAIVLKRGEPPIEDGEIARCRECHERWHDKYRRARAECDVKACSIVQEAKAGRAVRQLEIDWLRKNGYGDSAAAIDAMKVKRKAAPEP